MLWSKTFIPTLKEEPADAEVPSHELMLRAGLIRQLMAGAYTYLPLGLRALHKAEGIVREEMDEAGAIEICHAGFAADRLVRADRPRGSLRQRADQLRSQASRIARSIWRWDRRTKK